MGGTVESEATPLAQESGRAQGTAAISQPFLRTAASRSVNHHCSTRMTAAVLCGLPSRPPTSTSRWREASVPMGSIDQSRRPEGAMPAASTCIDGS